MEKYDPSLGNIVQEKGFTDSLEVLTEEYMYFNLGKERRVVTLKEYKFLLYRITKQILDSRACKSTMVNNYFLSKGFKETYKKYTNKSLTRQKLTYMLSVLVNHNFLYITYNSNSSRILQIDKNNPYFRLKKVPLITGEKKMSKLEKSESNNKMLEASIKQVRLEVDELKNQVGNMVQEKELFEIKAELHEANNKIGNMVPRDEHDLVNYELHDANHKIESMQKEIDSIESKNDGLQRMVIEKFEESNSDGLYGDRFK